MPRRKPSEAIKLDPVAQLLWRLAADPKPLFDLAALDPAAPGWIIPAYRVHALRLDEDELRLLPPR